MKKIKSIKRQDSGFKLSYGNSGETSINLSNEIFDFISEGNLRQGEEREITFRIYKEDCIRAMSFIIMKLPLYKTTNNNSNKVENYLETFNELYSKISTFFGNNKNAAYNVTLFYRTDGRIYLKGLRVNGFSIRDYLVENYSALQFDDEGEEFLNLRILSDVENKGDSNISIPQISSYFRPFITAIRTKPFLLLAGISGTGKSRIVRELAFKSCPEYLQDKNGTTPGNYCMIEVKPNWHDSTELLGYYSNMNKCYQFKKFVKFLVKAKMNPEVPFFICLDEMNLAPVEHYFAEMLSIMETRKHPKKEGSDEVDKDVIRTGVVVESQYFKEWTWTDENSATHTKTNMSDMDWYKAFFDVVNDSEEDLQIRKYQYERTLLEEGLTLPDNVIIIGTVNMDDTTHQFSRKVIDRAMTIEMNGGKLSNMFGGSKDLEYLPREEQEKWQKCFRQLYVNADEVLEAHPNEAEDIVRKVPEKLEDINKALKGTPFEVSYRVLNELTIMVGVLLDSKKEGENIDDIINQALDRILLMKILPRIEGDSDMFNLSRDFKQKNNVEYNNRLEWLMALAPEIVSEEQEGDDHRQTAREKIQEMIDRLENQEFTRFWP